MNSIRIEEKYVLKKSIKKRLIKGLYVVLILLSGMILTKKNPELKKMIQENIYEKSLPLMNTRKLYEKYMGTIQKEKKEIPVSTTTNHYQSEATTTGVKLQVKEHDTIENLESGIIVFISPEKTIIEQVDGVSAIYKNVDVKNYKMYDYLEKGDILGEASSKEIMIDFQKEGKVYDYKKYF